MTYIFLGLAAWIAVSVVTCYVVAACILSSKISQDENNGFAESWPMADRRVRDIPSNVPATNLS